jgi:hypothetical protein
MGPVRPPRWTRTGEAVRFGPEAGESGVAIGWLWEIRRAPGEARFVRVEVSSEPFVVTDLPAEARNAIRSRGATAVDAYLRDEDPPERIFVSTSGIRVG